MKRNRRGLSLIVILIVIFQLIPHVSSDIRGTNVSTLSSKSIVDEFSFQPQGLLFNIDNERANQRLSSTSYNDVFEAQSSIPYNSLAKLSLRKIHIDIRQRIKDILTSHFYGGKYIVSNLLI